MGQNQNEHLTTEQLSALLDKHLSAQEEAQSEAHLRDCQQCQGILNDLRQTVALLRALPQPPLPRSFALSPDMLRSAEPSQEQEPTVPVTIQIEERRRQRQQRQQARRSVLPRTLQVMGTLVALLGFLFLVSAFPFYTGGASSGNAGSSSNGTVKPTPTTPSPVVKPNSIPGTKQGLGGTPTNTPSATHSDSRVSVQATAQWFDLFNAGTPGGRAIDGVLLLVFALLILLIARGRRVRQT